MTYRALLDRIRALFLEVIIFLFKFGPRKYSLNRFRRVFVTVRDTPASLHRDVDCTLISDTERLASSIVLALENRPLIIQL